MRSNESKKTSVLLWVIQALLAALFLFAGSMKLIMPGEALAAQSGFPIFFMRFIGVAEVLGAIGLILPGALRIKQVLTPFAATGLVIIMTGATVLSFQSGPAALALIPLVVALLCAFVAWGRATLTLRTH